MASAQSPARRRLKHNLHRSVYVEGTGDEAVLLKSFHGQGRVHRWLDRHRARREQRALESARAAGLPVPEVLGVRREGSAWELRTEFLTGARELDALLAGRAPWPGGKPKVLRSLAQLHARALLAGFEHSDLHAGNVLIAPGPRPWLIDLAHARLRPTKDSAKLRRRLESQLLALGADARERLSLRDRSRYWCSLLQALPEGWFEAPRPFLIRFEKTLRERRKTDVLRGVRRWSRESSATRRVEGTDSDPSTWHALVRRDLNEEAWEAWRSWIEGAERRGTPTCTSMFRHGGDEWLTLEGSAADLQTAWDQAARWDGHHLPVARPAVLSRQPRPLAAFTLPVGARDWRSPEWAEASREQRGRAAEALGKTLGLVAERGLDLDLARVPLWLTADGSRALLDPRASEETDGSRSDALAWEAGAGWCSSQSERSAFESSYARARRGLR